ncbi:MAG TPA: toll/interleukin-1 receptor domain-containing protein [Hyphomicrobiales bacterium]|nr:toll/interleukin-1 receptor domain-containing protein [Hyphomicrobiales bacterium]
MGRCLSRSRSGTWYRGERALNEAARRCEAVVFLISRAWLASRWCMNELNLAHRLNKRLSGVLIEEGLAICGVQWRSCNPSEFPL